MSKKLTIEAFKNGPFKVTHLKSLSFAGQSLEPAEEVFLCRCGETSTPPYCDGTHKKVGFDGSASQTEPKPLKVWQGKGISTTFDPNICTHVLYCRPLDELRLREPEDNTQATAAEIAQVVMNCPSGALRFEAKEEILPPPQRIKSPALEIFEGAEIRVHQEYEALGFELRPGQPNNRSALCRCGRSKNKPFCNGAHVAKKDFK
ncbi:MAG: CDGSH iron-sulfur domain-containing protein [bacterium]|nr:CDGSH iron-sulfur domain-containing protein [bacterium]